MLTSASASALYTRSGPQGRLGARSEEIIPTLGLDDWNSAQAFSFCLTVRLLSYTTTAGDGENRTDSWYLRHPLLHTVPELMRDRHSFSDIPRMHVLANKAVGILGIDIRNRISTCLAIHGSAANVLYPPAAQDIPFASFMKLPEPFATSYIEAFNSCHLPAMTDPDFLVDEEWTGYFGYPDPFELWIHVVEDLAPVGGRLLNPHPQHFGERTVRFHVVRVDPSTIVLRSNCFHTWSCDYILGLTIDKNTGIIIIDQYNSAGAITSSHPGVITPFGIVGSQYSITWMWLWKTSWTPYWESLSDHPRNLGPAPQSHREQNRM